MKKELVEGMRRAFRKILGIEEYNKYTNEFVQYSDQDANDYIRNRILDALNKKEGLMISKFGTVELATVMSFIRVEGGVSFNERIRALLGEIKINPQKALDVLCKNAGFFPNDLENGSKYTSLVLKDAKQIDILGSYLKEEKELFDVLEGAVKVNLDGYYAPFLWENPWTSVLEDKRVLVIHPFVRSIKNQYKRRELLFDDPLVLPEFSELILIEAVQSIVDNENNYNFKDWFEALESMEKQIDALDFDVALIGCGAYGMHLASYVKSKGKVAVHLAGWTQMLFGIYGYRWIKQDNKYSKYINQYWVRPDESETPSGSDKIEGGCYW